MESRYLHWKGIGTKNVNVNLQKIDTYISLMYYTLKTQNRRRLCLCVSVYRLQISLYTHPPHLYLLYNFAYLQTLHILTSWPPNIEWVGLDLSNFCVQHKNLIAGRAAVSRTSLLSTGKALPRPRLAVPCCWAAAYTSTTALCTVVLCLQILTSIHRYIDTIIV